MKKRFRFDGDEIRVVLWEGAGVEIKTKDESAAVLIRSPRDADTVRISLESYRDWQSIKEDSISKREIIDITPLNRKSYELSFNPDVKDEIIKRLLEFFIEHEAFHGEVICQSDDPMIDAPNCLADIADMFDFKVKKDL